MITTRPVNKQLISDEPHGAQRSLLVTILTSSYGGGHLSVAHTLAAAVKAACPLCEVEIIDFFKSFVSPLANRLISYAYTQSVRNAPYLYGGLYALAQWIGNRASLQAVLNCVGRGPLLTYLRQRRPHVIVSTYPTPGAVVSTLRLRGLIDTPTLTILTDFAPHSQWVSPGTDLYIVATEELAWSLVDLGVPAARIRATGIPTRQELVPRQEPSHNGSVLITVGAQGMLRRAPALCQAIIQEAPHIVVICGHDFRLQRWLTGAVEAWGKRVEVYGFVTDMHCHYTRAALLVGKPGGLTVAEALAVGLPMVVYGEIPGHEHENRRFLVRNGVAHTARTPTEVRKIVRDLLSNPEKLARMSYRARALGKPQAAQDAATAVLDLLFGRH
ncbi:MAG: MGDG synthase family glycosyltransferase [Candidatus Zipacnadales bacterium]